MSHVHFTITGEFVTQHYRGLVKEGAWIVALQQLRESVHNLTYDHAIDILSGKKRIAGENNDIFLEDEDKDVQYEYATELDWLKVGKVRQGRTWYKLYGVITSFDRRDIVSHRTKSGQVRKALNSKDVEWRIEYYINDQHHDKWFISPYYGGDGVFLFQRCDPLPIWFEAPTDVDAVISDYLDAGHILDEYGSSKNPLFYTSEPDYRPDTVVEDTDADALATSKEEKYEKLVQAIKEEVLSRMRGEDDWLNVYFDDTGVIRVPRVPFEHWAANSQSNTYIEAKLVHDQLDPWEPVSPDGLKLPLDDVYHTDWIIGAGYRPETFYQDVGDNNSYFWDAADKIYKRYFHEKAYVHLVGRSIEVTGPLQYQSYNIIPNESLFLFDDLSAHRAGIILRLGEQGGGVIITRTGGKMAHICQVARDMGNIMIVRMPKALDSLKRGSVYHVTSTRIKEVH